VCGDPLTENFFMKRRRWTLAIEPPTPSLRAVRAELKNIIEQEANSFRESDGVIRNSDAIIRITVARRILELLPRK
jgi:hypothetical protein